MALLKRTVTPARLAANRRSAQHSTGPRTAEGKARSALNGLRHGDRSRAMRIARRAIYEAPAGEIYQRVSRLLTPAERRHPQFEELLERFRSLEERELVIREKSFVFKRPKPKSHLESDRRMGEQSPNAKPSGGIPTA